MTDKPKARRKASFMEVNANPFEQKATTGPKGTGLDAPAEFESLADTVKIERIDFDSIVSTLEGEANNEMRIKTLHIMKTPYLFTSEQLITLLPFYAILFLIFGGISFTLGVVFFRMDHIKYAHNIWHLFVLGGSGFHYFAMYYI